MKKKGHALRNCIVVILVLSVIYWTAVNVLVSAVLVPSFMEKLDSFDRIVEQSYSEQVQETSLQKNATAMYVIGKSWAERAEPEEATILSEDGYLLKGVIFTARRKGPVTSPETALSLSAAGGTETAAVPAEPSHRWAVLLHGYTGSKEMMYPYAYRYVQQGYNVLAPDFRCQGESEGDYIGLGATDSRDLLLWIDLILERDPESEIVLHGLSMGASTALILSGTEEAPSCIKAVISDCAFTDAYSMFKEKIGSWFYLPAFPVVDSANLMIRLRAGYDLKETSPLRAVEKSRIPTLFIHGREDRMIPANMCLQLYDAAACPKDILIVEGAGHAQAGEKDPVLYFDTIDRFLSENL